MDLMVYWQQAREISQAVLHRGFLQEGAKGTAFGKYAKHSFILCLAVFKLA